MSMKVSLRYPNPSLKHWACNGKDLKKVFESLNKHKWWGRYRSHHGYASRYDSGSGKVVKVDVTAKPEIIMPKWSQYSRGTKEEKASWDNMYKALKKHEQGHHVIFEDCVKAYKKKLETGGDLSVKEFNKSFDAFSKELQKKQDAYDSKTDHGKNQGVILVIP